MWDECPMAATEESMNTQLADLKAGQDALEAGQRALAELIKEECGKHSQFYVDNHCDLK